MVGAFYRQAIVGLALLACGASVAYASDGYDPKIENAVKQIVAARMQAKMRGSLDSEWRLPELQAEPVRQSPPAAPAPKAPSINSPSFIHIAPPAIAVAAWHAALQLLQSPQPERKVRVVYF